MRVAILDYGVGNLHSLANGLSAAGAEVQLERDPARATDAAALVLPGVGAFATAAARLDAGRDALRAALEAGLPCLAICLGMQLLFEASDEGEGSGLGLVEGRVTRVTATRVPHMGWNRVETTTEHLATRAGLRSAYFAHAFACRPRLDSVVSAWTSHDGDRFPAIVRVRRTVGVQFHPEKSSRAGIAFLRAFCEEAGTAGGAA
ncbi:MAG TPA: imidazole glycerol phosphate synthase subunit HisH [Gemmatimonadaceae bacterium]|nr:imidazole glycerol phosphate synthase subunit HisH [Gemmatimonadaceae bacterium]